MEHLNKLCHVHSTQTPSLPFPLEGRLSPVTPFFLHLPFYMLLLKHLTFNIHIFRIMINSPQAFLT